MWLMSDIVNDQSLENLSKPEKIVRHDASGETNRDRSVTDLFTKVEDSEVSRFSSLQIY